MTPKLRKIVQAMAESRAQLFEVLEPLGAHVLERRPSPAAWSPLEILEHLYRTERGIGRLIESKVPEALAAGMPLESDPDVPLVPGPELTGIRDRLRTIDAPDFVTPRGGLSVTELRRLLTEARAAMLAGLEPAGFHDLSRIVYPHIVLGPLNLYEWLLFCAYHEHRHTEQIREALSVAPSAVPDPLPEPV